LSIELANERDRLRMNHVTDGWHELITDRAGPGSQYGFILPDGMRVPDPASRYQPEDGHGRSEVIDPAIWSWNDAGWRGRPWKEAVIYELHVGTYTPKGTFRAVIEKLDHLVSLGVTAIQMKPIADFPGRRNWGYDGVLLYASDSSYGRPEDLKSLVEAAHSRRLMVFLDVVYNHFGPDGTYLPVYVPEFFTDRHKTPWGPAVNFDRPDSRPVRDFVIHNALYWVEQFHMDGLRLDAVHAILGDSHKSILKELAESVRVAAQQRRVHLIVENEEISRVYSSEITPNSRGSTRRKGTMMRTTCFIQQQREKTPATTAITAVIQLSLVGLAEGLAFPGQMMPYRGKPRSEL
jgi:malto-oligosyltrehalose trehalohydrolase